MEKRGQVTIFVILAIFIIGIVLIYFAFQQGLIQQPLNPDAQMVYNFVQECIEETAIEGISFLSGRGGYFILPDSSSEISFLTSYWIYQCQDISPTDEILGGELSNYIENQIDYCLEKNIDEKIVFGEKRAETKIEANVVTIDLNLPTAISIENSTAYIEDYDVEISDDLFFRYYTISKDIVEEIKRDYSTFDLSSFFEIADSDNFDIVIDTYNDENYLFSLKDRTDELNEFTFAVNLRS